MTRKTRLATVLAVACTNALALAGPAFAANDIVATDPVVASSPSGVAATNTSPRSTSPLATASLPRGIVVTQHGGLPVSISAPGQHTQIKPRPGRLPATFTGLRAGVTYTIEVGGQQVGRVTAINRPGRASSLVVRTGDARNTVTLSWNYTATAASGRPQFDVVATPDLGNAIRVRVSTRTATLTGLDPSQLYSFTVTPRNTAGSGPGATAVMTRTLADITGTDGPAPQQPAEPKPAPVPVAEPKPVTPAPAPAGPSTKTIYVCPDGFTEVSGLCQKTMAYTFHAVTETLPYTYHSEQYLDTKMVGATFNGTVWTWSCPSGYDAGGGQWGVGVCKGTVTIQVKDAPPAGYTDDGTQYVKVTQVKDAMPAGYTDDGTQWVMTAAKVAKVVPA